MSITKYQEGDHDRLIEIWVRAVRLTHNFLAEEDFNFYHNMLKNGVFQEVEIWVKQGENQEPVAFIGLDGMKIEMLFVDPDYHGQGIGTRLIEHARKLKGNHLKVDVNEQNEGAYSFYKRQGFEQIGRSELDGSGRPYPLFHLEMSHVDSLE